MAVDARTAEAGDNVFSRLLIGLRQQACALVPVYWQDYMSKVFHGVRLGLSPFRFGRTALEQGFAKYQAAAALTISSCFHWMSILLLIVVLLVTARQETAATLLRGPVMIAGMSVVILLISTYLPKTYKLFRIVLSAAYIVIHLSTLIHWRNELVPLKSAELALLHPARTILQVSAPLIVTHLILMMGVPLPMYIHVPLHTFILVRHMHNYVPLCRDVASLPTATAGPAAFVLGRLTPAVWETFTGFSFPGLDLIWPTNPAGVVHEGGCGLGWGGQAGLRHLSSEEGSALCSGPAAVASCSAVLSGGWLVAVGLGTLLLAVLEVAQRKAYLLQCRPAPRLHLEKWPYNDGEYMVQTLPHAVGGLLLVLFLVWYTYLMSLARSL